METGKYDVNHYKTSSPTKLDSDAASDSAPSLPPVLREFSWITLTITIFSALWCLIELRLFHRHYPYDWPFYIPELRYGDFTVYQHKFQFFHQASFFTTDWPFTYPAPMAVCYQVFYRCFGVHALTAFLVCSILAFAIPALLFARALAARGIAPLTATLFVAMLLLLSWPALLLLDRANVEVFVWIATAAGAWSYSRGKEWTAAILFGIATALKLFPIVLLGLFFTRRKYPKFILGLGVYAITTIVSLAVLGPTIPVAYHGIAKGLSEFHDYYLIHYRVDESGLDHTPLAFVKTLLAAKYRTPPQSMLNTLTSIYLPLSALAGILLYFLRIRRMPWLNQLLLLSIAAIYFTPFSGDGTLIHLYPAFALCCFVAIDAWRRGIEIPGLRPIMYCFAYLFAIESFVVSKGHRLEGQAKCLVLGILLVWALRYPLGEPVIDTPLDLSHPDTSKILSNPQAV